MLSKIKKVIKPIIRLVGKKIVVPPTIEREIYSNAFTSFHGGITNCKNAAIVTNSITQSKKLENLLRKEGYRVTSAGTFSGIFSETMNHQLEEHIDVFINMNYSSGEDGKKDMPLFFKSYGLCQEEANYYIDRNWTGKIINAAMAHAKDDLIQFECIKSMTEGLGLALGNHQVGVCGIVASDGIDVEKVYQWICFLSGKYGTPLAGEVLHLHQSGNRLLRTGNAPSAF